MSAKFQRMGRLSGLEGRRNGPAWTASTIAGFVRTLRAKGVCTTASDEGAIAVWRTRDGDYRMDRCRYRMTMSEGRSKTLVDVRSWLRVNLPLIERTEVPHAH